MKKMERDLDSTKNDPALGNFPTKWMPVRRKKMRQIKNLERPIRFRRIARRSRVRTHHGMQNGVSALITVFGTGGAETEIDATALCERLEACRSRLVVPFAAERIALVASVSDAILARKTPVSSVVTHFGFWIRRAALNRLGTEFASRHPAQTLSRPRGLVFHLPPKNVETVFLYSWLLSFLAGNANVVRLPRDISPELRGICDLILAALDTANDRSQMLIHYPAASDLGRLVSAQSDVRIVWGGDAKIAAFESLPLRNGGKSLWFGDRVSLCVLDGDALAALDDTGRRDLAHRLVNDIFVFDQMACSSPHALYVTGDAAHHLAAVKALLETLARIARDRGHAAPAGHQITKMVRAFSSAAAGASSEVAWRNGVLTSAIAAREERAEQTVGGGFLTVVFIPALAALIGHLRARDQTVTHFGFRAEDIRRVAESNTTLGVSRWTPVGTALDFDPIWDGYDLISELTRLIRIT